jgi:hypothetical protein
MEEVGVVASKLKFLIETLIEKSKDSTKASATIAGSIATAGIGAIDSLSEDYIRTIVGEESRAKTQLQFQSRELIDLKMKNEKLNSRLLQRDSELIRIKEEFILVQGKFRAVTSEFEAKNEEWEQGLRLLKSLIEGIMC